MGEILRQYPVLDPRASSRSVDGEAVVVTPHDSQLHALNEVGSRILELADGRSTGEEIAAQLCAEFEVEPEAARADLQSFLTDLVDRGILELRTDRRAP